MSELIVRLRSLAYLDSKREAMADTLHDAADEIARLRWQIVELHGKQAEIADERDDLRRQLDEAEQRFDWLATRLEDVQIDDADPNDHYHGDEEDVPYPVLWRRAIDAAMGLTRTAEAQR